MSDPSDADFRPVEANLRESFRVLARGRERADVMELPGVSIASLGATFQMFNAAFLNAPVGSPGGDGGAALPRAALFPRTESAVGVLGSVRTGWNAGFAASCPIAFVAARDETATFTAVVDQQRRVSHRRHVARQSFVFGDHVLMGHGKDRHVHARELANLVGVDAACVHDHLALDGRRGRCSTPVTRPQTRRNGRHACVGEDLGATLTRALRERRVSPGWDRGSHRWEGIPPP